ncbi:hypothetical protein LI90_1985 [Carbonactinospora thermoautotrophica]|uniref:Uncharacterized protein n=1 Tax=Carbonactinospora thermoautotrophica TaxID=1469144 RepID=A0A132MSV9_9ACTN|nr:hypothetical protein [Carbonactinospora thermoautotrophica]KWX00957.1 hypothetical protein LI90_1985 [Carbonactinospora thermoautotrophica]
MPDEYFEPYEERNPGQYGELPEDVDLDEAEMDLEEPVADAVEQRQPPDEPGALLPEEAVLPLEADEADAAEQRWAVPLDEEDYR